MVISHRKESSTDMEAELHRIESDAYCAVLRALTARGGPTWDHLDILHTLRKELQITEPEHRNFIAKVASDSSINVIRQTRVGTAEKGPCANDIIRSHSVGSVGQESSKRIKTLHPPSVAALPSIPATHFNQSGNEAAKLPRRENIPQPKELISHSRYAAVVSKGMTIQSKKTHQIADIHNTKNRFATVEIRATNELLHEVERLIYGGNYPNSGQVERAKLLLKEQERAILGILDKLAEFSDDEDSYPNYDKQQKNGHQPYGLYEQVDTAEGYYNNILNVGHADGGNGVHTLSEPVRYLETP